MQDRMMENSFVEIAKVATVNLTALTIAYITELKDTLSILSILVALGYSVWKWRTEYKKNKKK